MNRGTVGVIVIFDPVSPELERVASFAAVGVVQARGQVRLRRLAEAGDAPSGEVQRIRRVYVVPQAADLEWAGALLLVGGTDSDWSAVIEHLAGTGPKVGVILSDPDPPTGLEAALGRCDVTLLPIPVEFGSLRRRALVGGRWAALSVPGPVPFEAAAALLGPEHEVE